MKAFKIKDLTCCSEAYKDIERTLDSYRKIYRKKCWSNLFNAFIDGSDSDPLKLSFYIIMNLLKQIGQIEVDNQVYKE